MGNKKRLSDEHRARVGAGVREHYQYSVPMCSEEGCQTYLVQIKYRRRGLCAQHARAADAGQRREASQQPEEEEDPAEVLEIPKPGDRVVGFDDLFRF